MRAALSLVCAVFMSACTRSPQVQPLAPPAGVDAQAADATLVYDAVSASVLMSWVSGDSVAYHLYVARSQDSARSWSEPVRVTTAPDEIRPHAEASPRLVAHGDFVGVFWPRQRQIEGRRFPASEMRFARSLDGGRTWSAPVTINDDTLAAPAGHTFHGATMAGDSTLVVAWLDSRAPSGTDGGAHHSASSAVYTAESHDLGKTWPGGNTPRAEHACPCCRVALASTSGGEVMATWRGHFDGDVRDPVIALLGPQVSAPQRVHADNWIFPACPHSGPGLALDAADNVHVTWFTGASGHAGVYYARAKGEQGFEFTDPVAVLTGSRVVTGHPAIAAGATDVFVAVNAAADGERSLTVARIRDARRVALTNIPDGSDADHPSIVALPGEGALVAWTQSGAGRQRIRLARVW
jgi:hypothetical protein